VFKVLDCVPLLWSQVKPGALVVDACDHLAEARDVASGDKEVSVEQERVLSEYVIRCFTLCGAPFGNFETSQRSISLAC